MSTLTEQIDRITQAKADLKQAITEKGITVADNALIDEYDEAVKAIEVGGGSDITPNDILRNILLYN